MCNCAVKCQYKEKCIDYKKRCDSCKNNEIRSYYEPVYYDYWRIVYPYPNAPYPWYPDIITWTTTTGDYGNTCSSDTTMVSSYYVSNTS